MSILMVAVPGGLQCVQLHAACTGNKKISPIDYSVASVLGAIIQAVMAIATRSIPKVNGIFLAGTALNLISLSVNIYILKSSTLRLN